MTGPNFALFYAGDAYSTSKKIMGRQSAGKALMRGVARRWPRGEVHGFGNTISAGEMMLAQLRSEGFTGVARWRQEPGDAVLAKLGAVYYPAPPPTDLAHARNALGPTHHSLFGVTHTLSSNNAMEQVASLIMPPFQPWDALICTSSVALGVVGRLQDELRDWMKESIGATRFNPIQLPVIPLGVDVPAFVALPGEREAARTRLGLAEDEVAFLFAGRLTFHAKANPAPFYIALEEACRRTGKRLVGLEAGVYPNAALGDAFQVARKTLAPSARFLWVDGNDNARYADAWKSADVFVSLSDNIQETYGLTPVEAMAAGLPVLVSDWNGYKDTIRDGVDGFRIPTVLPPAGVGADLAGRHASGKDNYDYFIGRVSLATAVEIEPLVEKISLLSEDRNLRLRMGASGRQRAADHYDWPEILDQYVDLAGRLAEIRRAQTLPPKPWPLRPDPFALFADYPTSTLTAAWRIGPGDADAASVDRLLQLNVANYAFMDTDLTAGAIAAAHAALVAKGETSVGELIGDLGPMRSRNTRAVMWLAKFGLIRLRPA